MVGQEGWCGSRLGHRDARIGRGFLLRGYARAKHGQERSKSGGSRKGEGKVLRRVSLRKGWDGNVWGHIIG